MIDSCLFFQDRHDETMRVAAEFLCIHGDDVSAAGTLHMSDQQNTVEPLQNAAQRRWVVQKAFIDLEGAIRVDRWAVRYSVYYTFSDGKRTR